MCLSIGIHSVLLEFGCDTEIVHLLPFLSVLILKPRHPEVTAGHLEERLQAAGVGHVQSTCAHGSSLCQPQRGSSRMQWDLGMVSAVPK